MENEQEIVLEESATSLNFDVDNDPFNLEGVTKEVEPVALDDVFDTSTVKSEDSETEESEETKDSEEIKDSKEEEKEESNEAPDELKLSAAKSIIGFLAERKGVLDEETANGIEAIETLEEIEEFLENLTEYDNVSAVHRLKQTDATIAKIVEYIEAGGEGDDVIKHLTQVQTVASMDVTTESGAKELLKAYYSDVLGFSEEVINKRLRKFEEGDQLLTEAEDIQPLFQEHLNKKLDEKTKEVELSERIKQEEIKIKETNFIKNLQANKYSRDVASELFNTAFRSGKLQDGSSVTIFDHKLNGLKSNPNTFLKLVEFINNPERYDAQILANKGSEIVMAATKQRLVISGSKPGTAKPINTTPGNKISLKF